MSYSYTNYYSPVIYNFFTFYWTPDNDDQTCLTMTYYTRYYQSNEISIVITFDVNDEYNNMVISPTELEKYVILFSIDSEGIKYYSYLYL